MTEFLIDGWGLCALSWDEVYSSGFSCGGRRLKTSLALTRAGIRRAMQLSVERRFSYMDGFYFGQI